MPRKRIQYNDPPIVFVSCSTFQKKRIFKNPAAAQIVVDRLYYCHRRGMLNHYHALFELKNGTVLPSVLHSINSYSAWSLQRLGQQEINGKVWQQVWDVWIRSDYMYWQKIAYTLLNPWRARLVDSPLQDYRFSDIALWKKKQGREFMLDLFGTYGREGE